MPLYAYVCDECGAACEQLLAAGPPRPGDLEPCPGCGSGRLTRQVSMFSPRGTRNQRRGKVVDLSSGCCPCAAHGHAH